MERPILEPAPVVAAHAVVVRALVENHCQFRHCQHDLTGLIVWPTQSRAHIARGSLDRADNTHLSRFFSEAPWREDEVHRRRIRFRLPQTTRHRRRRRQSRLVLEETRCEPVGSLVDHVDRRDHHRDGTDPLAHHPVTSFHVRGPVRFPVGWRLYRRDEELTQGEASVAKHVPERQIPTERQARHRLQTPVDPVWLQEPECRARHEPFRTTIALAIALVEEAIRHPGPCGVVVLDAWSRAEEVVRVLARRRKDWSSLLHTNRLLETASVHLRDAHGWTLKRPGPPIGVAKLVPVIPATAYRPVTVGAHTYWGFTRGVRLPGLGKGRLVVSGEPATWTGRQVVRVTNRVDGSAAQIISLYAPRWPTDTFDQDGKGPLGCNASRLRSAEAMGHHGCLVCVASSWLHRTCLPAVPERTTGLIHTMGDACRHQGRVWLQRRWLFVHDQ